jgi:hypothetical protein
LSATNRKSIVCTQFEVIGGNNVVKGQRFKIRATIKPHPDIDTSVNNMLAAPPGNDGRSLQAGVVGRSGDAPGNSTNWFQDMASAPTVSSPVTHKVPPDRNYYWGGSDQPINPESNTDIRRFTWQSWTISTISVWS